MTIRSFRDLRVWQVGMDVVDAVYAFSATFPRDEIYALSSQMRRAAISVPANIAEGHTREGTREYLQFLSIARGSLAELETHVAIAQRRGYATPDAAGKLLAQIDSLGKQLSALRNALRRTE